MKYRARVTAIQAWIYDHYDVTKDNLVRDATDTYIEVSTEEEARDLEILNDLRISERIQKADIIKKYNRH